MTVSERSQSMHHPSPNVSDMATRRWTIPASDHSDRPVDIELQVRKRYPGTTWLWLHLDESCAVQLDAEALSTLVTAARQAQARALDDKGRF